MKWKVHTVIPSLLLCFVLAGSLSAVPERAVAAEQSEVHKGVSIVAVRGKGGGAATVLEIKLSAPVIYTCYKSVAPLRLVVDLSRVSQSGDFTPLVINQGNFKSVTAKAFTTDVGPFTRMEIGLEHDSEPQVVVATEDPTLIRISFPPADVEKKTEDVSQALPQTPAPVSPMEPPPAPVAATVSPEATPVAVPDVPAKLLTGITIVKNRIVIATEGKVEDFKTFRLKKPERYVIDLMNVRSGLATRLIPLNASGIASARLGIYPDKVRVVIDGINGNFPEATAVNTDAGVVITLEDSVVEENAHTKLVATTVEKDARKENGTPRPALQPVVPVVTPGNASSDAAPEVSRTVPSEKRPEPVKRESGGTTVGKPVGGSASVEKIDFQLLGDVSRVSIKVSGAVNVEKPVEEAGFVTVTFKNSHLPPALQRSIDTSHFDSPVLRITPAVVKTRKGVETRIRIATRGATPCELHREGDRVFIDFKQAGEKDGELNSFELLETKKRSPRSVHSAAADDDIAGALAPISDSVSRASDSNRPYKGRKVTLEFADAEVRKIFQLLSEVSNKNFVLGDEVTGSISLKLVNVPWDHALDIILDTKGLDKREDGNIILIKGKGKFRSQAEEELELKKTQLKNEPLHTEYFPVNYSKTSNMKSQVEGLLTATVGKVSEDERTNTLIVTAIKADMENIRTYLGRMDVPERQVMIEARIIEATSTFTMNLGVSWGAHYRDGTAQFMGINQMDNSFGGLTTPALTSGQSGMAGTNMGISFGRLASNIQLDMRLNAAASAGLIKIVSTPKIATLNNKTAKITQGQSIPYSNTTATTGATTQFVQAALSLEVKPHINANGTIGLEIKATNNSAGAGSPPPINTKEATTEMLLKDGETTVIGGIYKEDETLLEDGVPFLMDIPFLGRLFKSSQSSKIKSELLIFITPRILN